MGQTFGQCNVCPDGLLKVEELNIDGEGNNQVKGGVPTSSSKFREAGLHFDTLLQAFKHCDPQGTGYITDKNRFAKVARVLCSTHASPEALWEQLDQDGNGAVSFPEFVEWAETSHIVIPVGLDEIGGDEDEHHGVEAALGPGGIIPLPHGWTGQRDDPTWNKRIDIRDGEILSELQHLLNITYKKVWTRDRKATKRNEVPTGFTLSWAKHSENYDDWKRYYMRRHQLIHDCSDVGNQTKGWFQPMPALTSNALPVNQRHRLRTNSCNEWLLFHGTNPAAVEAICGGDFTLHLAGSATGTLYGRGTYFAESITKADEYASEDANGDCCVLLCRVVGGRVLYNDEVTPNAQALQDRVLAGECHSILGDREKCRKTFKEYIIFDADQVYVEYALFYKRIYAGKVAGAPARSSSRGSKK